MLKIFFAVLCSFLCSFLANPAFAFYSDGVRPGTLTFTVGGGYDFFAHRRHLQNAGVPMVALGYDFTDHWGIEGLAGFFHAKFKKHFHDREKRTGNLYAIDGIYHFFPYKFFEPYILAGVGLTSLKINHSDANDQGNINGGIGLQLFIDPLIAFRLEARDFYTIINGKNDVLLDAGIIFFLDLC